jgi:3-deoxy-D-manno-octulosonic-acid transferase
MYVAYSLLILLFGALALPYLAYQAIRYKKYIGSVRQRLGYLPVSFNFDGDDSIWIHAVSVGEALTVRSLVADLKRRYPNLRIFLSTTTMSGQQVARRNLQDVDEVFYFPFDLAFAVRRTLRLVKPRLFVMMETEIWPNLLRQCQRNGVASRRGPTLDTSLPGRFFERFSQMSTASACRPKSRRAASSTSAPTPRMWSSRAASSSTPSAVPSRPTSRGGARDACCDISA